MKAWFRPLPGKYLKFFRRLRRAVKKNLVLQGFVFSSDKLPYSRWFSPLTRYQRDIVSKRFAVRDSVYLNYFYEYKTALLPFVKTFWVPRLYSSLMFCDYRKTLLSFGITVFADCADVVSRYNYEAQKTLLPFAKRLTRCMHDKVIELSEAVARCRRIF